MALVALLLCGGCGDEAPPVTRLMLASTTSLYDSGLLDVLLPAFEAAHAGVAVRLVAVGSGHALELGRRGDADALLVHSPDDEQAFMRAGHGVRRLPVMHNDFIIVGPAADPAGVQSARHAAEAMSRIAASSVPFISRGDGSGTHRAELALWQAASVGRVTPDGVRVEVGQGMSETLAVASERQAYTLTDRATYLSLSATLHLVLLFEGGAAMKNEYSVITTARARNHAAAAALAAWLVSRDAAGIIDGFGRERFGRPLFVPGSGASWLPDDAAERADG